MLDITGLLSYFRSSYQILHKKDEDYHIRNYENWNQKYTVDSVNSTADINNMIIDLFKMSLDNHTLEDVISIGQKLKTIASKNTTYKAKIMASTSEHKDDSIVSYWRFEVSLAKNN